VIFGTTLLIRLMERFPIIAVMGAGLIGWVGGETIASDVAFKTFAENNHWLHYAAAAAGTALVIGLGNWLKKRHQGQSSAH
jgi:predicted tellurium resistance membrane protein TerC